MRRIENPARLITILIAVACLCTGLSADDSNGEGPTVEKILRDINGGPVIPHEANRIYIPPFRDRSKKEGLTDKLMIRLKESFSIDRRLAVVEDLQSSDLVLEGEITSFQIQKTAFNALGITERKRMRVTVSMRLIKTRSRTVISREGEIQSFKEFSDSVPPIESEPSVFEDVIADLARRITDKTVSGWYTDMMTPVERGKSR